MAGDVSYFWSCVFSLFCLRSRSIYTNIIGNHTTTLCTTPTKCTSQLLESQDFRCVLLLFWQHTTEQKNHQNQKFKDTQRLIRLHAQRLLISHLWVNTTSDSIAYYFVVFLAFYHFVLIAFIRFPFSLMVIVCFPKCSRTGDTHTHTLECLVRCSKGWRTEMTKARRACLIIYTGPIYWSTASLNAESSSHKWDWRTEPNRTGDCFSPFVFLEHNLCSLSHSRMILRWVVILWFFDTHTAMFDENETRFLSCLLLTYLHKNIVILFGWIHDDVIA